MQIVTVMITIKSLETASFTRHVVKINRCDNFLFNKTLIRPNQTQSCSFYIMIGDHYLFKAIHLPGKCETSANTQDAIIAMANAIVTIKITRDRL